MKILAALLLVSSLAFAQTASPSWSGIETQQFLANCVLHNSDSVVCVATDGISFSYQGAAFVKLTGMSSAPVFTLAVGTVTAVPNGTNPTVTLDPASTPTNAIFDFALETGAAGANGATGPQGAQGIPGPVQSFGSLTCGSADLSTVTQSLTATKCTETTP